MKSVLKYPGAKNRIARWICGYIPEHNKLGLNLDLNIGRADLGGYMTRGFGNIFFAFIFAFFGAYIYIKLLEEKYKLNLLQAVFVYVGLYILFFFLSYSFFTYF